MRNLDSLTRHRHHVSESLRLTRLRIAEAVERSKAGKSRADEEAELSKCSERELANDACADPTHWPMSRLVLSETEMAVLWVLIAQELCPATRHLLRQLASEQEIDVSTDVLRRVIYGGAADPQGWYELSPAGALARHALVERIEIVTTPAHRTTVRLSRRVLALVHGQLAVDDELASLCSKGSEVAPELCVHDGARVALAGAIAEGRPLTILWGTVGSGRRSLALDELARAGRAPLSIDLRSLAVDR
ncbi:MAG: hypothetical protein ABI678_29490, partial [Kofleriaceae bacterium]